MAERSVCNNAKAVFLLFIWLLTTSKAQLAGTLSDDEVETIREIAKQLNKKDWNFSDPCSNKTTIDRPHTKPYNNTIICNCTISANSCHVEIFDLTQNYLSGSIPQEWASTKLERLVLNSNNLSGPIPGYLGNITTLRRLDLESNLFSGTVPSEFGKLVNLEELDLNANNHWRVASSSHKSH